MPQYNLSPTPDTSSPAQITQFPTQVRVMESNHRTVIDDAVIDEWPEELGLVALGMYTYLERRAGKDGTCQVSYARIADDTHMSRRHVIDLIAKLQTHGYVTISKAKDAKGNNFPNTFTLPLHLVNDLVNDLVKTLHHPSERPSEDPSAKIAPKVVTSNQQVVTEKTKPPVSPKPKRDPIANPSGPEQTLIATWCGIVEAPAPANYRKALGNAKSLVNAGITAENMPSLIAWMQADAWYGPKGHDLGLMVSAVDKWRTASRVRKAPPSPLPAAAEPFPEDGGLAEYRAYQQRENR